MNEHLCCILRSKKPHRIEAKRQWLSDLEFAKNFSFEVVDTDNGYESLALYFDGTRPKLLKMLKSKKAKAKS